MSQRRGDFLQNVDYYEMIMNPIETTNCVTKSFSPLVWLSPVVKSNVSLEASS